ncbi:MAG: hybrid sensor histidine kinase/response regulator [Acidobacteria bacterium]|nr:hybrid sensor histidine kinase/response regulator [Acidobacteriota bacterium]
MTSSEPARASALMRQPVALRYAVALGAIAAVFLVDRLAGGAVDEASHFLLLGTMVTASAWFAGTGPALAAVVLGALMGAIDAGYDPASAPGASLHLALFVIQGLLLTGLVAELRSARRAAEGMARVEQEARLQGQAANRMRDEFLATVSHELRTPLNAVLGWVHLLRTGKLDEVTASRGLEAVERNIRLQAQLTGELLDVSRALTGRLQLESQPTTLNEAMQHAAAAVESAARARDVRVERAVPDDPVVVLGDPNRLRQIVWHLLANAIKFSPRGGTVEVSAGVSAGDAWLRVQDSGPGIDPAFLPRIFGPFTQADSSATRAVGGLGVGLALVRELVELQGGEIHARNRDEGTGAVFTVLLPSHPAELLSRAPRRASLTIPAVACPPLDGVRVLVFDQSEDGRELVQVVLERHGAVVRAVASVGDALEALESWRPDVLLSDTSSPDQDSYSLIGKVHSLDAERGGRIPALALTAARRDARWSRLLANVQCDLPKPMEPAVLASEVARITGRERRRVQR